MSVNMFLPAQINAKEDFITISVILEDNTSPSTFSLLVKNNVDYTEILNEYSSLLNAVALKVKPADKAFIRSLPGVKSVSECTSYEPLSYEESTFKTVYAPGSEPIDNSEYGKGKIIAVIDNGFDLKHSEFKLENNGEVALGQNDVGGILNFTNAIRKYPYLNAKSAYKSAKIPFAFDYFDNDTDVKTNQNHGTAVMSAAAGKTVGSAPQAQVLAMKVYDNAGQTAKSEDIVAALEDAYVLGADVVCLGIGSPCGFSKEGFFDALLEEAIASLEEKGITVVCAAGNFSSTGQSTLFAEYYGYDSPLASLPDSGTVSALSTLQSTLSVASAAASTGKYPAFILANEIYIPYSDPNVNYTSEDEKEISELFDKKTLEYVLIPGLGKSEDYEGMSTAALSGKIALIKRGEITFAEKVNNAEAYGAIGAIIYDNTDDYRETLRTRMQLEGTNIPAILITAADAERMLASNINTVSFEARLKYVTNIGRFPTVSEFSSLGPTPTLDMKPEITAVGEDVTLAGTNGSFISMSGTSVSAGSITGLTAAVYDSFSHLYGKEKVSAVKNYLMNCALPMQTDAQSFYSVNLQGAGLVSSRALNENKIQLLSNGSAKIILGNELGKSFEIPLSVKNNTDTSLSYKLSAIIGTDSFEAVPYSEICSEKDAFYKETGMMMYKYLGKKSDDLIYFRGESILEFENSSILYDNNEVNIKNSSFEDIYITLAPNEVKELTLSVNLSKDELEKLSEIYSNGMYIQGYIFLENDEAYSIPFLGFTGDFYDTNPFDTNLYDGSALINGSYLFTYPENGDEIIYLGTNALNKQTHVKSRLSRELAVISPTAQGLNGVIYLSTSILKNIEKLTVQVYSVDGESVTPITEYYGITKSVSGASDRLDIPLWDFRSEFNDDYIYDDGKYTCVLKGFDSVGQEYSESFEFILDSEKPELVSYKSENEDGKTLLYVTLRDNSYIAGAYAQGFTGKEIPAADNAFPSDSELVQNGIGNEITLKYDITSGVGNYIYIKIYDIAFNTNLVRIVL